MDAAAGPGGPVEVTVAPGTSFGPVAGVLVRRSTLGPRQVMELGGLRCTDEIRTDEIRTAVDLARLAPLLESVPLLDALLHRAVVPEGQLRAAVRALPSCRGSRQARGAVDLVDDRAESPPDSRLRVLLTLAGLAPVPQWSVRRADGVFLARVDLAFPAARLAVEYDGAWHGAPGQLRRDRRRLNALVAGWRVVHVTAADLHRPAEVFAQVTSLLATEMGEQGV